MLQRPRMFRVLCLSQALILATMIMLVLIVISSDDDEAPPTRNGPILSSPTMGQTEAAFFATGTALDTIQTMTAVQVLTSTPEATLTPPPDCASVPLYVQPISDAATDAEDALVRAVLTLLDYPDTYYGDRYNALWRARLNAPEINFVPPHRAVIGLVGDLGTDDACEIWRIYAQFVGTALQIEGVETVWVWINYERLETLLQDP